MYSQNNRKWKEYSINNSKTTIGEVGCLLTSICNIYNIHHNVKITPITLNTRLINNNGYTDGNLIIWSVVESLLDVEIQHIFTGKVEYDMNSYYIVNFLNFGTGHFTNLISKDNDKYNIFDVWDSKYKVIDTPRRLVKMTFKNNK